MKLRRFQHTVIKQTLAIFCLFLFSQISLLAQQNPFDVKKRLPSKPLVPPDTVKLKDSPEILQKQVEETKFPDQVSQARDTLIPNADSTVVSATNPFALDTSQVVPSVDSQLSTADVEIEPDITVKNSFDTSRLLKNWRSLNTPANGESKMADRSLLFGITILSLLLLASLLAVNRGLVRKAYRAIANDNYLRFLQREYRSLPWIYYLFYGHFFLQAGFFFYQLIGYFHWYQAGNALLLFMVCLVSVTVAYFFKHLLLKTIGYTFPVDKETGLYGFVVMLVNILLGLALLPVNLLMAFGPENIVPWATWTGIVLVIMLYTFRQLKGLFISGRLLHAYLFHFFLYLCSAEIAPLLIIGKLALDNFEVY